MRRLFVFGCVLAAGVLCAPVSNAQSYSTILDVNNSVTGIRGTDAGNTGNALLTGSEVIGGEPQVLLWEGNIYTGAGTSYSIVPEVTGTISTSNYYGPDTPEFNSSIPDGQIRAVGTYGLTGTVGTFGFMYTGTLASGTYAVTSINVPGATNTIPHSTAGNIVVGAYDDGSGVTGNGFIYSISDATYQTLSIGTVASLYGVWQTSANTYVVAGGAKNPNDHDANEAFLADYDSSTGLLSDEMYYTFDGGSQGAFNHFEGITAVDGGYDLIATVTGTTGEDDPEGAALAFIGVDSGTFSDTPVWTVLDFPDSNFTTGNTVYEQTGLGVYGIDGVDGTQTFTGTIPEPSATGLVTVALLSVGVVALVRKTRFQQAAVGSAGARGTPRGPLAPAAAPGPRG